MVSSLTVKVSLAGLADQEAGSSAVAAVDGEGDAVGSGGGEGAAEQVQRLAGRVELGAVVADEAGRLLLEVGE